MKKIVDKEIKAHRGVQPHYGLMGKKMYLVYYQILF